MNTFRAYWELMRLDRPVGTFLLLWPTLAALWIAAEGLPPLSILAVFVVGTFVMRAAGCVVNDIVDRKFDPYVERTKKRPLADGRLRVSNAWICFAVLIFVGGILLLLLNPLTRWMAVVGLIVSAVYPFMKRYTHLPQVGLGIAFSWGIPMAGTAISESISLPVWLLFWVSFVWIVAYDTLYAMVDREDDLKLNLKSTAILFGKWDIYVVAILYLVVVGLLLVLGYIAKFHLVYFSCVLVIALLLGYQVFSIRDRDRDACFRAFKSNTRVGLVLFLGIVANFFIVNGLP